MKLNKKNITSIIVLLIVVSLVILFSSNRTVIEAAADDNFLIQPISTNFTNLNTNKTITTVGEGKVEAIPDIAYVNIGVITEGEEVSKIQEENNLEMNKIMGKLKELKIKDKNVKTSNYSINPSYSWDEKTEKSKITGYRVNNTLTVTVENIDKNNNLLGKVIESGGNSVNGIVFGIKDSSKLYNQALELAVKDAQEKAITISKAIGISNIEPIKITEVNNSDYRLFETMDTVMGSTSISQGTLTVLASVSVDFSFNNKNIKIPAKKPENIKEGNLNINDVVELSTNKKSYNKDETLKFNIKNLNKEAKLIIGRDFRIKKFNGHTYEDYPLDLMFTMELIAIEPGGDFTQELNLSDLEPGEYQLIKRISIDEIGQRKGLPLDISMQSTFTINN